MQEARNKKVGLTAQLLLHLSLSFARLALPPLGYCSSQQHPSLLLLHLPERQQNVLRGQKGSFTQSSSGCGDVTARFGG
jgi:hypothetical protein